MLVALLVVAGCANDDATSGSSTTSPAASSTAPSTAPPTTAPTTTQVERDCPEPLDGRPASAGPYAVGRFAVNYLDPSRRTEPAPATGLPASLGRALRVSVLYPAQGDAAAPITDGAAAAVGRFPVVVYAHGVASSGEERHDALGRWASAGYVVVAPTFPLSSGSSIDISDLPNQPGDVEFVTETFRSEVQRPDHPLHDSAMTDCLALAGHSLGGATALAASFDPCCDALDPDAVIDIAGVAVNLTPGASFTEAPPRPLLIVHGALDATVPVAQSEQVFAQVPGPRWFLTFPQGAHSSMFLPPEVDVMTAAVVAFLDAELKGAPDALEQLPAVVDASGIATLQVAPAD